MATATALMTLEDLLAMPNDGVKRWLVRGELRERKMTKRNRFRCLAMANLAQFLANWCKKQPEPRGQVFAGEVGCNLRGDPDSANGIDVVYLDGDQVAKLPKKSTLIEGPPALAVEILSPNNTIEDVEEKTRLYRETGVKLVWIVNPYSKIVIAYRPKGPPEFFHAESELIAADVLPGFRVPVAELFE